MSADRVAPATAALLLAAACAPSEEDGDSPPPSRGGVEAAHQAARFDFPLAKPENGDGAAAAALLEKARGAVALGQPDEARKRLDEALAADPASVDALVFRGTLLLSTGFIVDPSLALVDFRKALLLAPQNASARVGEVVSRTELEDDARAEELARALLRDADRNPGLVAADQRAAVHRCLARVAQRARRFDEALREVDLALALRADDRTALMLRAEVRERNGGFAEAEADLALVVRLKPDDATAHFARARVLRRLGRDEEADRETRIYQALIPFWEEASKKFETDWPRRIELRRQLVEAWPEFRRARHLLVRELMGGKQYAEARVELEKLVQEMPGDAEAWFLMAKVRAAQGDQEGAKAAADRMLEGGKTPRPVYEDLLRQIEKGDGGGK